MKRLFVASDIHGHYTELVRALDEAGFDAHDENHVFLCCGDLFDRGNENRKVFEFVRNLERKILVKGNHDERLSQILTEGQVSQADRHNATVATLEEFFGYGCVDNDGRLKPIPDRALVEQIQAFIATMRDYYETEHYVFVHGWLPTELAYDGWRIIDNWRDLTGEIWEYARWSGWPAYYARKVLLPRKTIVCGHRTTRFATRFDRSRAENDDGIFYGDRMIAMDAWTVHSKKINILVVDEETTENEKGGKENATAR